jgi:hypothetical protein
MIDKELEKIRQKKIDKLKKIRFIKKENSNLKIQENKILNRSFTGRAWEIFNISKAQFPKETLKLKKIIVKLIIDRQINKIDGEQLYHLIRQLGLPLRLKTSIKYLGNGEEKPFSVKFKESIKE